MTAIDKPATWALLNADFTILAKSSFKGDQFCISAEMGLGTGENDLHCIFELKMLRLMMIFSTD